MLRKLFLAGLMTATVMGGIAPAYAQSRWDGQGGRSDRGQNAERGPDRGQGGNQRGDRQWQGNRPSLPQPVQQPAAQQPAPSAQNWQRRGDTQPRADRPIQQARPVVQDRRDGRADWQRDNRQDGRQDGPQGNRQDWRNDGRNDNRGDGWTNGRNTDRNGGWNNGARRFDDRTRWSNQRRWDNGWRQDRRYDWSSYRARYGDRFRAGRYYAPRGWSYGYRPVSIGFVLSSLLYSNSYWLDDPYSYRLPPAYGSLRWVRYYDDALLVDTRDGYVVDAIQNFFW